MTLVVDASVAFKWFAQKDGTDRALALLERGEPIVAPDVIPAEPCNAAWKSLRRRELTPVQFEAVVNDVAKPFARLVPLDQLDPPGGGSDTSARSSRLRLLLPTPKGCRS